MKNEYFDSLHDIEMSEERKSVLIDVLAKEIEANNMTNIIEMPAKAGKKKRARAPFRFAAALVACMVAGSGAAYAASPYVTVGDAFDALFNGAPAKTEVADSIGRPIGATASADGVTITADAIIGDANTLSIVYSVTFEDGIPEAAFDQDRALIMRGGSHVWGADGAAGSAHFFDADPSDNTLQYVEQMFVDADDGIVGRTCTVEFDELLSVYAGSDDAADEAREPIVLAEGGWSMRFTIDYEDTTVAFTSGQTVSGDDHNFEIANVNLSPVSITIEYVTDAKADVNSGGYSEQVKLSCPCSIVMDDGSRVDLDFSEFALTALPVDGGAQCRISKTFSEIIDIDHVAYIEIGSTESHLIG